MNRRSAINPSNQHEFNGNIHLRNLFGAERQKMGLRMVFVGDRCLATSGSMTATWYDARENQPLRPPEFRLVYSGTELVDLINRKRLTAFFMKKRDGSILILFTPQKSNLCRALVQAFGLHDQLGPQGREFGDCPRNEVVNGLFALDQLLD